MIIWMRKDNNNTFAELIISLDPPEKEDEDHWIMLTTREVHYNDIANNLDKQVKVYNHQNDHRAARVARDLAQELRNKVLKNENLN